MATQGEKQRHQERRERLIGRLRKDVSAPDFESVCEALEHDELLETALEDLRADLRSDEDARNLEERPEYKELLNRAKFFADFQRQTLERRGSYSGSRPGRTTGEVAVEFAKPKLSDYEKRCAQTYSEYQSPQAARRLDVLQFRAFTLGGALGDARPTGKETDEKLEGLANAALLRPDEALTLARSEQHEDPGSGLQLRYAADDEAEIFAVEVLRNSVLDRLRLLSEKLAESFPWHPADAARWLLTSIPPAAAPIRARRYHDEDVITITALPFVDARTITANYRNMQREIRRRLKGEKQNAEEKGTNDNKRVSEKALNVLLFVEKRTSFRGERPDWPALKNEWNAAYPEWAFKGENRAGFKRRYEDAHKVLLGRVPPAPWH